MAASTFVVNTLDLCNYKIVLQEEDISALASVEYAWFGGNGNVVFKVIRTVEQLKNELEHFKRSLEGKMSITFIINLNDYHWVTLVITKHNQQLLACYVDSVGEKMPCDISNALKDAVKHIEHLKMGQKHMKYDSGILALENAKFINEVLHSKQHLGALFPMPHLTETHIKTKREKFAAALRTRARIESKFEVLLKYLKNLNKCESRITNFNFHNSNIVLLFFETLAFQDLKLKETCQDPSSKLINQKIIDEEDHKLIKFIRSCKIFHRESYSIIYPADFTKLVSVDYNVVSFFQNLEKYVEQTYMKLKVNRECNDQTEPKKPKELFRDENEIDLLGKPVTYEELRKNITSFFKKVIVTECYRNGMPNLQNGNEMMFNFLVNIIPFVSKKYRNAPQIIKKMKEFRGKLFHAFYEFGDNYKHMLIELKNFVHTEKNIWFIYYYSQEVCFALDKFRHCTSTKISRTLRELLNNIQSNSGKEYLAHTEQGFELVYSETVFSKIENKTDLESCVHNYFKLMSIIDNEEAVRQRKEKYEESVIVTRHVELNAKLRREIYEDFKQIKINYEKVLGNSDTYDKEKELLLKKCRWCYGISKDYFNAMINSYVENDNDCFFDEESMVTEAVFALIDVKNNYDVSDKDIINMFNDRKQLKYSKGSCEEKISCIPEGMTKKISVPSGETGKNILVSINTDRFSQNIFEIFSNPYIKYKLEFNNIEDAFNDDIFLDFLSSENLNVSNDLLNKLLEIEYMTPYIARLVTKDELIGKIVTDKIFLQTIEKLLMKESYIKHLKRLLKEGISDNTFKINDKKLKRLLNYKGCDIKAVFYEYMYNYIISSNVNIENMYFIFEEVEYTEGILKAINKRGLEQDTELIKNILRLLNNIADELIMKDKFDVALKLLDSGEAREARKNLIETRLNDYYVLEAKRIIACIKIKQGSFNLKESRDKAVDFFMRALKLLCEVKDAIQKCLPDNTLFPQFLLTLSDLAYTHHLLHECRNAYYTYEILYKEMIKFILKLSDEALSQFVWNEKYYHKIVESEVYESIVKLSPKYLDILKIKSDMAYELKCVAEMECKSSKEDSLLYYKNALKIYSEIFEIRKSYSILHQDIVKTVIHMAYINYRCGYVNSSIGKLECALSHYEESLEKYRIMKEIQANEKWGTHPAVLQSLHYMVKVMCCIGYVNNQLGHQKQSQNPTESVYHYSKAVKIYEEALKIQENVLNEENEISKINKYIASIKMSCKVKPL